jgi:hypothetical protein
MLKKTYFSFLFLLTISHFVFSQQMIEHRKAVFEKSGEQTAFVAIQVGNYRIKVLGDSILPIPVFPYNPYDPDAPPLVLNFNNLYHFLRMDTTALPAGTKEILFDWKINSMNNHKLRSEGDILQAECLLVEAETGLPLKNLIKMRFGKGDAFQDSFSTAVNYWFEKQGYRADDISAYAGKRVYTKIKINHEIIDTTALIFAIGGIWETIDTTWANLLPSEIDYSLSVKDLKSISELSYRLYQNYPNPFNTCTTIALDLSQPDFMTIEIYNLLGEKIRTIIAEKIPAGKHRFMWNGTNDNGIKVTSGIYFCNIKIGETSQNIKMAYLR